MLKLPNIKTNDGQVMKVRQIVAMDRQGYIGYKNDLIFHNPEDLKFFKEKTLGHICVMGRKTFDSLPKILPQRQTVVITSKPRELLERIAKDYELPPDTPFPLATRNPIDELPLIADQYKNSDIWVCGSISVYNLFMPYTKTIVVTQYSCNAASPEGVKAGLLPEDYDERDLVRYPKNKLTTCVAATLFFGNWNGIRYVTKTYTRNQGWNRKIKDGLFDARAYSDDFYY